MRDVITLMLEDEDLIELLGASHIYPNYTTYEGDCIIYDFHTTLEDRITQRVRLQITIIATSMAKTLEVEKVIKHLILTLGDEPLNTSILQVELNGGGTLYDTEREKNHRILYFDILKRSE